MRVIAGLAKGTRLAAPRGLHVRPTLDRVKTSMFDLLGERVVGAAVLDVFSGTGSLGIEALSRGAESCLFVERTPSCLAAIRANLPKPRLADRAHVMRCDVLHVMSRLRSESEFDLVLAAPPYRIVDEPVTRQRLWRWLSALIGGDMFVGDGLFVLEHRRQRAPLAFPQEAILFDSRTYGDTTLSLLGKRS